VTSNDDPTTSRRAAARIVRTPGAHAQVSFAVPVTAGLDPFQREHEIADALLTLLIAHSRYGVSRDADRLPLIEHIVVLLAHEVGERVERMRGKDAARAFRKVLARRGSPK
jgi:hypothetical protein